MSRLSTLRNWFCVIVIFCIQLGCDRHAQPRRALLEVEKVEFSTEQMVVKMDGDVYKIGYRVSPVQADTSGLSISSEDPSIFSVEGNGYLTPKKSGTAKVLVTNHGVEIASLPVTVRAVKMYSIGNSHTADFAPFYDFPLLALGEGVEVENDWHINCGQSIASIMKNPSATCVDSLNGGYTTALNQVNYDIVTIQPFSGGSGIDEVEAIFNMIKYIRQSKSKDAKIYIYYTWPLNSQSDLSKFNYTASWEATYDVHDTLSSLNKNFVEYLKLELVLRGVAIDGYIPAGDVLNEIHKISSRGAMTSFKGSGELYRDSLHLNNMGRFVAGLTVFYSLFGNTNIFHGAMPAYFPLKNWIMDREIDGAMRDEILSVVKSETARK